MKKAKAKIVVSGRLDLVPKEVREACIEAMEKTKENAGKVVLNVCLAYSGAGGIRWRAWKKNTTKKRGSKDERRERRREDKKTVLLRRQRKSNNTCASRDSRIAGRRA